MNIDLSILKRAPQLNVKVQLEIVPLAPLSMVAYIPGAYYKSVQYPTKKMLCGVFENILGWHFNKSMRNDILKDVKNICKKQEGSTYLPLLMDYFDFEDEPKLEFDSVCFYNDLWTRLHSRIDSIKEHIKKCRNLDKNVYDYLFSTQDAEDNKKELAKEFYNNPKCTFPFYYPIPTKREYIHLENGKYIYNMTFDNELLNMLEDRLGTYNMAYLGNSEGWVDITLKRL